MFDSHTLRLPKSLGVLLQPGVLWQAQLKRARIGKNEYEKIEERYAQFANAKEITQFTKIDSEIAGVLAAKEQRIRQLQGETGSALGPRIASEGMESERPSFGGEPGEPVPQVDAHDVRAVWKLGQEAKKDHPGENVGIASDIFVRACKAGANIQAVFYRTAHMAMLQHIVPEIFEPWTKDGELLDSVFRAAAEVPMEWIGVGVVRNGLPFDVDDLLRRLREA
jgi:hypothetical protein